MTKALANKIKTKRATKRESFVKVLKTQMKIATAVAIRATAATNIAQTACEQKQKNNFASGKSACEQKANKARDSTRIIYESIKNSYENGHGRGHKSGGGDQYCTDGLRKNKK